MYVRNGLYFQDCCVICYLGVKDVFAAPFLTWQRDEGLTPHPSCQQPVNNWRPLLPLKSGEQRHQLCEGCLCTQVLHTQNLRRDRTSKVISSCRRKEELFRELETITTDHCSKTDIPYL